MLDRKIAVITGSTGGIGSAIADQLAAGGWDLVLVNRSAEKASQQKTDLNTAHPEAKVDLVQADLMDTDQIKRAAREILAIHSSIDALYNNSGVFCIELHYPATFISLCLICNLNCLTP